ncbi:MAG: hypothetical protein E7426_08305 [Ruminococcaceae bacterium]|jgi:hypothetical protein|nr:hypothetical protein [Oscillospiraceae bacterium]
MKIEALYTEACNLYGDAFNVEYLRQSVPEAEIIRTPLNGTPRFMREDVDLIYMGPMTEQMQEEVIRRLRPCMDRIRQLVAADTVFLMTGNALEVFGREIDCEDGRQIRGLELYDGCARRQMFRRYNALFLGQLPPDDSAGQAIDVVGFKSQFSHTWADNEDGFCFQALRGGGIHPGSVREGIRIRHFFGTYLLGPLLPLNPPLTRYLLHLAGVQDPHPAFEAEAQTAYETRLREFRDPRRRAVM